MFRLIVALCVAAGVARPLAGRQRIRAQLVQVAIRAPRCSRRPARAHCSQIVARSAAWPAPDSLPAARGRLGGEALLYGGLLMGEPVCSAFGGEASLACSPDARFDGKLADLAAVRCCGGAAGRGARGER